MFNCLFVYFFFVRGHPFSTYEKFPEKLTFLTAQLLYPLKTSENLRFSDVFRGYRSETVRNASFWEILRTC